MRDDRLPWPDRAGLPGIVTEGDDKIERSVVELFPRLAVDVRGIDFEILAENLQREWMRCGFWTSSGAIGFEPIGCDFF